MAFADVLFPRAIAYGSQGGPEFSTTIVTSGSRREQRNRNLTQPVWKWNVLYGIKTLSQYQDLYHFFLARAGKWQAFRLEDPADHTLVQEPVALGDGVTTTFQTIRTYTSGVDATVRTITKLTDDFEVFVDSDPQTGVTVEQLTGRFTLAAPPAAGQLIAVTGTAHFAARFDTDYLPAISEARGQGMELIMRIESIPLVEAPGE
jgi:uncharacterized protein (TIGR02217 family)